MGKRDLSMNPWLNLRKLLDLVAQETDLGGLDDRSQRILEWVAVHYDPSDPMYVQTIVTESQVASPATVHKCLSLLERKGLLSFEVDPTDSRRRIVSPTEKTRRLFRQLGDQVYKWAGSVKRV